MNTNNILSIAKKLTGAILAIDGGFHAANVATTSWEENQGSMQDKAVYTGKKLTADPTDAIEIVAGAELLGIDTVKQMGLKPKSKKRTPKKKKR